MKKNLVVLFCFLLFFWLAKINAFSIDTYFDFSLPARLLLTNHPYKITFSFILANAQSKDFTVKPVVKNGAVEIYDADKNLWVGQNIFRSNYPRLTEGMQLKISRFENSRLEICFEIQHLKSATLYRTPCRAYWNGSFIGQYLALVNDKILKWTE